MESREPVEPSKQPSRTSRFRPLHAAVLIPVLAVAGLWAWRYLPVAVEQAEYAAEEATFAGGSKSLERTTVVPTLDTPLPRGRNVIWCSSFQLAWNQLRDEVIKVPVELIGKMVANVRMPIIEALQTIEFRLDRSGAMVESDALVAIASQPRYFEFNRPFLVYMDKRGAEHPFFVMWVDNAELLVRE